MNEVRRCTRCVMDDRSDSAITFDEHGHCSYCTKALSEIGTTTYFPDKEGARRLDAMLKMLKDEGRGKPYDCVMGISGGLDSSYLAYLGYKWGLRILAVHIDDGYDTTVSKSNIQKLCKAANVDLRVIHPDPKQFNDLTLAYMRAGVPNLAIPQDNVLVAFLFDLVRDTGVKYFLSGGNFALECILQHDHVFNSMDTVNIRSIHRKYGTEGINRLKFISSYRKYWYLKTGKVIQLRPLNFVDYNRDRAFCELADFCGFEYYGGKHLENILTAFIQLCWFPRKFGVDKRTSHLSSMIVSGQMTREEALQILEQPMYDEPMMDEYVRIIKQRLGMSDREFDAIMAGPPHEHTDYRTDKLAELVRKLVK